MGREPCRQPELQGADHHGPHQSGLTGDHTLCNIHVAAPPSKRKHLCPFASGLAVCQNKTCLPEPAFIYPLGSLRPPWCKEVQASTSWDFLGTPAAGQISEVTKDHQRVAAAWIPGERSGRTTQVPLHQNTRKHKAVLLCSIMFLGICYAAIACCNNGESIPRRGSSHAKALRQTLLTGGGREIGVVENHRNGQSG